jgi:hypothetical protein
MLVRKTILIIELQSPTNGNPEVLYVNIPDNTMPNVYPLYPYLFVLGNQSSVQVNLQKLNLLPTGIGFVAILFWI